jgi:hypothetical protein
VHSRVILVDDIALRKILAIEDELKLVGFGQSVLLPSMAEVDTVCENDLTAQIEILHLGCIVHSITIWSVHEY